MKSEEYINTENNKSKEKISHLDQEADMATASKE